MPSSFDTYNNVVGAIFTLVKPQTVLDIGCGAGKHGRLAKSIIPEARRVAIEVHEQYIDRYQLRDVYDEIRVGDATEVLHKNISEQFDLVIMGDCIEHMPKSVGLDLLNYLTYRSQYILVIVPEFIIQHEVNGVKEEAHVSVWSEHDFFWHDCWAWDNCWTTSIFLLRGYQPQCNVTMDSLVNRLNESNIPLFEDNSNRVLRNLKLNLETRVRENVNQDGIKVLFRLI